MNSKKNSLNLFLTFNGNAEEALKYYEKVLPDAKIETLTLFSNKALNGDEGKVLNGVLDFQGIKIMFMDMQKKYPVPAFSWSTSLLINCSKEAEFDIIFNQLSQDGSVMMGPEAVEQFRKVAWVTDKYGLTWQLVWE
ncbi:VOC family protein [Vagococcus fluvialis]|uniref:VOC family protein n=1 Tax=Vagococcus fluvialis TaxID=2738 RepID=UPI001A8C1790|nr:VOC family protein [Vagococcus fluvialis]MBO0444343.1 VOC family protein [Vagococcus fluvialis]